MNMNMSMWLSGCASTCEEIVINDEDLLTLILLRVPYRKLKSFKCVSKKWLCLITSPQFSRLLCNLLPPLYVPTSRSDSIGDFHVYSSETGTWRLSIQSFYRAPHMYLGSGVYWHGCIYWLGYLNFQPVPGSTVSYGLYFNVDEGRLGTFPRPPIDGKLSSGSSYFGESGDHLHFIGVCPNATSLSVYELKSDYSEWFIKYWIDLAPISKVFPEMTKHKACYVDGNTYVFAVLSLIRRENFQEDSFLVLEIPGKVIRYNLVDTSFKAIWDFDVDFAVEKVYIWGYGMFRVWQYIEALSCV